MREAIKSAAISFFRHILIDDRVTSLALSGKLAHDFIAHHGKTGKHLLRKFREINRGIQSATQWPSYVVMAEAILSIPRGVAGDVVECGCYKGASTSALSLICAVAGRKLVVCDSFQGLPVDSGNASHVYPHLQVATSYQEGSFKGTLEEVKRNVSAYGDISVCEFVPGFFSESLKGFDRPVAFAFLDVDLRSSMEDCIRNLWPCMPDGTKVFTDDSCDMEVVKLWFDRDFWSREMHSEPPGYVGSGCGIPSISPGFSSLGYTVKGPGNYKHVSFGGTSR